MKIADNWSELPRDLLVEIAKRATSVEDLNAFRGVCTSWRTSLRRKEDETCLKFHNLSEPRLPFLMLSAKETGSEDREFFNLSKGKVCMRLRMPGAKNKRCIESGFGWLLSFDIDGGKDVDELLNPFSGARIPVPARFDSDNRSVTKSVLSADPSVAPNDFILVVIIHGIYVAFWRPGEENWTWSEETLFRDVIFSGRDRKFYAFDGAFSLIQSWDGDGDGDKQYWSTMVWISGLWGAYSSLYSVHMVESSDEKLLLIHFDHKSTSGIFIRDVSKGVVEEVTSLKDAIFITDTVSIALPPNQLLQSNRIYYAGWTCKLMYDLEDRTIQPFPPFLQVLFDSCSSLLWVAPPSTFSWFS